MTNLKDLLTPAEAEALIKEGVERLESLSEFIIARVTRDEVIEFIARQTDPAAIAKRLHDERIAAEDAWRKLHSIA